MLSDLAIGWLQEEVLLQMYARFAMQPAAIPDVVAGWEQPPGAEEAQSRRRLLATFAVGASGEQQQAQRHGYAPMTAQRVHSSLTRSSDVSGGNGSTAAAAAQWRSDSSRRSAWRYRRRKVADGKRRAGRSLAESSDAVGENTAAGTAALDAALDPGWLQVSVETQPHHRRRQRQHEQQEQESRTEAGTSQYSSDELADPPPESLYPELPPPMFEQNAGADARRCCRRLRCALPLIYSMHLFPATVALCVSE